MGPAFAESYLSSFPIVPQTLLREADPYIFRSTSSPTVDTEKGNLTTPSVAIPVFFCGILSHIINLICATAAPADLEEPFPKGSRRPDNSGAMMSDSLLTYAYIKGKHYSHACMHS